MRTIIISNSIYKITEREYKVIKKMEEDALKKATMGHKQSAFAFSELEDYLHVAKTLYRRIGEVDFHLAY